MVTNKSAPTGASGAGALFHLKRMAPEAPASKPDDESLQKFLRALPVVSVGQKHCAQFECELAAEDSQTKLVWLRLVVQAANESASSTASDITVLSLDKKLITRDKRFRVGFQAPRKWTLALEQVAQADDGAYFVCQAAAGASARAKSEPAGLISGARLNVLVPPKLIEAETSPNLVSVDEFDSVRLSCKVRSEPSQSQISWRREDGRPVDGLEQRFKHQLQRSGQPGAGLVASIDSSELLIERISRQQAGAYLCIASNGVQPGVSQRVLVVVQNCRQSDDAGSDKEPCEQEQAAPKRAPDERQSVAPKAHNVTGQASAQQSWKAARRPEAARNSAADKQLATNRRPGLNANGTDKRRPLGGVISGEEHNGRRVSIGRRPQPAVAAAPSSDRSAARTLKRPAACNFCWLVSMGLLCQLIAINSFLQPPSMSI